MTDAINSKNNSEYQLIILGIELIHKVFGLQDCNEELASNPHVSKVCEAANKWNDAFIRLIVMSKE